MEPNFEIPPNHTHMEPNFEKLFYYCHAAMKFDTMNKPIIVNRYFFNTLDRGVTHSAEITR